MNEDVRTLLLVARADVREAERAAAESQDRAGELERELARAYAELLDLRGLRASSAGESREVVALRSRFAAIAEREALDPPLVTVLVASCGDRDSTVRCLRSIAVHWSGEVNAAIVVIDDASPEDAARDLIGIPGVDVLSNGTRRGYLRSNNAAIGLVQSKYVCFLAGDTEVRPGWLERLVAVAEEDATVGAVGSKLVYANGKLREAGNIIWSDGSDWNVGRGDDPAKDEYNLRREVDYCSTASLLVRTAFLRDVDGFDDRYAPTYFEDADLCFACRARGYKVVYEPHSEVVQFEAPNASADIATDIKRLQKLNRSKFVKKWRTVLGEHGPRSAKNMAAAMRRLTNLA